MKHLIITVGLLLFGFGAIAQSQTETFQVWGNCGMCKRIIEKTATGVDGVKYAVWDMETDLLTVKFKTDKTSTEAIKKAIAASGYDTEEFRAPDEVYNNLHGCCQYERPPKSER